MASNPSTIDGSLKLSYNVGIMANRSIHNKDGDVIIPPDLAAETDKRLTCVNLWTKLANLLMVGEDTLQFEGMEDLATQIGEPNTFNLYPQLKRLESLGWITRTRGINSRHKTFTVTLLPERRQM